MAIDLPGIHSVAVTTFAELVGRVADQWDEATPCDGWNVRELVNHTVAGNFWVAELATGKTIEEVGDRLDGDVLGTDAAATAATSANVAAEAFNAPGAMEAACAVSYGPVPGSVYCGHRIIDNVGHTWDLATAIDADTTLDADHVAACIEIILPQFELLKGSGMFGDAEDLGDAAEPQERLIRLLGR